MNILAYDTSGDVLAAALVKDGQVIVDVGEGFKPNPAARHSSVLVPTLEKLMRKARWKPEHIDAIAVGTGPGSFTGIRIGVVTAKMLAFAWGKKVVGVSSLEAIARSSEAGGRVAVMLDARRGNVYAALYEKKAGTVKPIIAPLLTRADDFFKKARPDFVVDSAAGLRAGAVAEAARGRRAVSPDKIEPLYLHPKDCNVTVKR